MYIIGALFGFDLDAFMALVGGVLISCLVISGVGAALCAQWR